MAVLSRLSPSLSFGIRLGSLPELLAKWWSVVAVGGGALYVVTKVLYRRFFHPLANVPGPFLPAVTRLYAWYFNVPNGGKFYKEIERLHNVYGAYSWFQGRHRQDETRANQDMELTAQ